MPTPRSRRLVRCCLTVALALCAACGGRSSTFVFDTRIVVAEDHHRIARRLAEAGDAAGAIREFTAAIELRRAIGIDHSGVIYSERGDCHALLGEYELAALDYQTSIERTGGGSSSVSVEHRLEELLRPGIEAGIAAAEQRVVAEPDAVEPRRERAFQLLRRRAGDDVERAVADLEFVAERTNDPRVHWLVGDVCFEQGLTERAIVHYVDAYELDPYGNEVALERLGHLAAARGQFDAALAWFAEAAEAGEKRSAADIERHGAPVELSAAGRARCYEARARIRLAAPAEDEEDVLFNVEKAFLELERAFALDPESPSICLARLEAKFAKQHWFAFRELERQFDAARAARPGFECNWTRVAWMCGLAAYHEQRWDDLERRMRSITEGLDPEWGAAWYLRAIAAENTANNAWAPRYLEYALRLDPELPPLDLPKSQEYHRLAAAQAEREQQAEALAYAEFLAEQQRLEEGRGATFDFEAPRWRSMWSDDDEGTDFGAALARRMSAESAFNDRVHEAWRRSHSYEQLETNLRLLESLRPD